MRRICFGFGLARLRHSEHSVSLRGPLSRDLEGEQLVEREPEAGGDAQERVDPAVGSPLLDPSIVLRIHPDPLGELVQGEVGGITQASHPCAEGVQLCDELGAVLRLRHVW